MKRYVILNKNNIVQSTFEKDNDWVLKYNDNDGDIIIIEATNSEEIEGGYTYKPKNKKNKFLPPKVDKEQLWFEVRSIRTQMLRDTDWTQIEDNPLTKVEMKKWVKYRQELRDITKKFKKPEKVIWPVAPGSEGDK